MNGLMGLFLKLLMQKIFVLSDLGNYLQTNISHYSEIKQ